jgi:hypothetical protein
MVTLKEKLEEGSVDCFQKDDCFSRDKQDAILKAVKIWLQLEQSLLIKPDSSEHRIKIQEIKFKNITDLISKLE